MSFEWDKVIVDLKDIWILFKVYAAKIRMNN